jgi:hypothetical protein
MINMTDTEKNLRSALTKCLERLHDYFGLTDAEITAALDEAARDPKWSPYDNEKWKKIAYPPDA